MADQELAFYHEYMAKLYPQRYAPAGGTARRKRRKTRRPNLKPEVRAAVLARDGRKCHFCRSERRLHVHHMLSRAKGGTDDMDNLLTVCCRCHTWLHEGEPVHSLMAKTLPYPPNPNIPLCAAGKTPQNTALFRTIAAI